MGSCPRWRRSSITCMRLVVRRSTRRGRRGGTKTRMRHDRSPRSLNSAPLRRGFLFHFPCRSPIMPTDAILFTAAADTQEALALWPRMAALRAPLFTPHPRRLRSGHRDLPRHDRRAARPAAIRWRISPPSRERISAPICCGGLIMRGARPRGPGQRCATSSDSSIVATSSTNP
jgi:hypothetical protein